MATVRAAPLIQGRRTWSRISLHPRKRYLSPLRCNCRPTSAPMYFHPWVNFPVPALPARVFSYGRACKPMREQYRGRERVRESATYRREEARVLRGIDSCRDIFHVAHASFALCAFACHVRRVPIPHKSRSGAHFRYPRHAPIDGTHLPCHDFKCAYIRATTLYFLFRSFKLLFTILQLMGGPRLSSLHYYTLKSRREREKDPYPLAGLTS
jgi:hypothetical protein